ncbi:translation initiation factor IF-2 [Thermodesulfobacteriota bacterium]
MAKVRVYELARELNLESKALVEKLQRGGIKVKNYMSTLDEETVAKAKDIVSGAVSEVIVEKRIKPTVIRRRKKTVKVEAEKEPEVPEEEPVSEAPEEAPEVISEAVEPEPEEGEKEEAGKAAGEPEEEPQEAEVSGEIPEEKPKAKGKAKKAKKKKSDQPAKIIKMPEEGPLKAVIEKQKAKKTEATRPTRKTPAKPSEQETIPVPPKEEKGKPTRKKRDRKKTGKEESAPKGNVRHRKYEVFERADLYEGRRVKPRRKDGAAGKEGGKSLRQTEITVPKASKRRIKVQEQVTVSELAKVMGIKAALLVKKLISMGVMVNVTQAIDFETASLVADEFGYELELDQFEMEDVLSEEEDNPEALKPRPPVVTIMGHVDHGKTSLLDYIRQSNIIAGERGGITQHIGAYYVERESGDIVFLDTPGHEAFTSMRARGAKITDLIVLVVAADDGAMPQTKEAINHARAASIPIVVAINKIDKANANREKVMRELAELELAPEDWGGDTIFGNISAKTGEGIDDLLELIQLQSEILELKANPDKPARGTIIEAKLDKSKGALATVLIKSGSLSQGDHFICGGHYGRVRAMVNSRGKRVDSAGPSVPVEIYGISGVPMAGDEFVAVEDEKKAKQIIDHRMDQIKSKEVGKQGIVSLDDLFEKIKEGEIKELNIVIKADVQGSLEALSDSLQKLSTPEVKLKIIHSSTGAITETDVMLASASGAIIIGFNVRANPRVVEIAEKEKIDIRYYDVIYDAIQNVRNAMAGLLDPIYQENFIGRVEVKEIFRVPKIGTVAGCYVTEGHVERNANIRLLRDEVVVYNGKLSSLRRFKDDVREVQSGYECGIGLVNYQDIKPGDVLEAYEIEEIAAEL